MALYQRDHYLAISRPSTQGTAVTEQFFIHNAGGTNHLTGTLLTAADESGTTGTRMLGEYAPSVIYRGWTRDYEFLGDNHACVVFVCKGSTGATTAAETTAGTTVYRHRSVGPQSVVTTTGVPTGTLCFGRIEDIAAPGATNDYVNKRSTQVVVERVELVQAQNSPLMISASLRGAATFPAIGGAPTAVTNYRASILGSSRNRVFTSTSLTLNASKSQANSTVGAVSPATSESGLTATVVDAGALGVSEFRLTFTNAMDLDGSQNYLSQQNLGVGTGGDGWDRTSQQLQIELLVDATMTSTGTLAGIADEHAAGTRRGWEFWWHDSTNISGNATAAYAAYRVTVPCCYSVSATAESDGMGKKMIRLVYQAGWDSTDSVGWLSEGTIKAQSTVYN